MKELNSWMKIQENILANMTIRLEEPPTQKEEKKVDQNKSVNIDNIKNNEDQEDVKGKVDDDMKDKEELEVKE